MLQQPPLSSSSRRHTQTPSRKIFWVSQPREPCFQDGCGTSFSTSCSSPSTPQERKSRSCSPSLSRSSRLRSSWCSRGWQSSAVRSRGTSCGTLPRMPDNRRSSHTAYGPLFSSRYRSDLIILVFSGMAVFSGAFSWDKLWDIAADAGQSAFLPHGIWPALLFTLPFAMWFFLGIEELPLAAEESHNPVRDIPRAGLIARGTLIVTGLLVLFLNTGVVGAGKT